MKKYLMMIAASVSLLGASSITADAQRYVSNHYRNGNNVRIVEKYKRQGPSRTAQGAIIGGVAGAGLGYVIGGNGKGAIIGGLLGAGAGALYGNHRDNTRPDNRPVVYKYKKVVRPANNGYGRYGY